MNPEEMIDAISSQIEALGKPAEHPSAERLAELWSMVMMAARKDMLAVNRDELWYFCATAKEVERLKAERDELADSLRAALATARFERHPFRAWHKEAEEAIAKVQK